MLGQSYEQAYDTVRTSARNHCRNEFEVRHEVCDVLFAIPHTDDAANQITLSRRAGYAGGDMTQVTLRGIGLSSMSRCGARVGSYRFSVYTTDDGLTNMSKFGLWPRGVARRRTLAQCAFRWYASSVYRTGRGLHVWPR